MINNLKKSKNFFPHLVGKRVNVTVDGTTFFNKVLHFAGINMVGHSVVTFKCGSRCRLPVNSWKDFHVEVSDQARTLF